MGGKLNDALENVKQQMSDPESATIADPPESSNSKTEENVDMSAKKKAKKTKAVKKTNGAAKPPADENTVTLKDLAKSLKVEPHAARIKLRKAEIENPGR